MSVSFNLPIGIEEELAAMFGDLGQAAKEAFTMEGYRSGRFGIGVLRRLLGIESRWEAEQWLFEHHVSLYYTATDFDADCRTCWSLWPCLGSSVVGALYG